ncbi:hypothetical protein Dimus_022339, partial [Dionaea muscipula]
MMGCSDLGLGQGQDRDRGRGLGLGWKVVSGRRASGGRGNTVGKLWALESTSNLASLILARLIK